MNRSVLVSHVQFEDKAHATQYIGDAGAGPTISATADDAEVATGNVPAQMKSGRFLFTFTPDWPSSAFPETTFVPIFAFGSAADTIDLRPSGSDALLSIQVSNVVVLQSSAITISVGDELEADLDAGNGVMRWRINGGAWSEVRGAPWMLPPGTLYIGHDSGSRYAWGKISEPYHYT